jgi:predicted N-acetyltransferase YhbS
MTHDPLGCCLVGHPGYYRKFGLGHAFAARRCEELKADITAKIDKKIAYGKK